jgi:ribose transport system permease protein
LETKSGLLPTLGDNLKKSGWGVYAAFAVECLILGLLSPYFLTAKNLFNVMKSITFTGVTAVGQTMLIISGGLDLSVGSMIGLGGMVPAALMTRLGVNPAVAVLAGLAVGAFSGFFISIIVTHLKINSFIVTLGMLSILRGFTYLISKGSNIFIRPKAILFLGQGYLGTVPFPVIVMIFFVIIGTVFLRYTVLGRQIYAVGGNERAARLAGVQVNKVRLFVFMTTSILSAFAGLISSGFLGSAEMTAGTGLELDVIAAVIIGGASLSGGKGTIVGSLVGAAIMGVLRNGFVLVGLRYEAQIISIGVVIILAVVMDSLRSAKTR